MAPSERAKQTRRVAEGGSVAAQAILGLWHLHGMEGLQQDEVKAVGLLLQAADLGNARAQGLLATCYYSGYGVEQNYALAVEWGRKAANQGNAASQFAVGRWYARGVDGKMDLPLGKQYLELSATQGDQDAVALLKQLRKCVACEKLDVHHMICSRCHNRRYCGAICQLRHWNSPVDPHKLHCVKRRESARVGGSSSERADPSSDNN